jgi:hypothetical protein
VAKIFLRFFSEKWLLFGNFFFFSGSNDTDLKSESCPGAKSIAGHTDNKSIIYIDSRRREEIISKKTIENMICYD